MGEFPETAFVLGGDPASIRASGSIWQAFGTSASETGADLRHLDSGEFDGDEADTYRSRINHDLPPYLDTTSQAWTVVATALTDYADLLEHLQTEMTGLRSTGYTQWNTAQAAQARARDAASDDAAHAAERTARADALPAGKTLPPDTYRPAAADANAAADRTAADLQGTIAAATGVRTRNTEAVDRCVATIDRARAMRFADPPGWLGALWDDVCGWVADHIDILQTLSAVLKKISGIAGMLAMIPFLAPLAAPIALAAGGLAAGIDAGIKVTTGQGDWTQIGLDMAACIPGAKMATAVTAATTTRDIANGNFHLTDVMAAAAFGAAGKHLPRPNGRPSSREVTPDRATKPSDRRPRGPASPTKSETTPEVEEHDRDAERALTDNVTSRSSKDSPGATAQSIERHHSAPTPLAVTFPPAPFQGARQGVRCINQLEYAEYGGDFRDRALSGGLPVRIASTA